jgi:pimeloyl-ACP methyl ester carboxylesterase
MTLAVVIGAPLAVILILTGCQRKMIYLPQPYPRDVLQMLPEGMEPIAADMDGRRQVAFYMPPRSGQSGPPERLWIVFGGNGSVALAWHDFAASYEDEGAAFLLVDYPGYGLCEGRPKRHTIREGADALIAALAEHLGVGEQGLAGEVGYLGHSLGAAVALEAAQRHGARRVVMVSPFTSLVDMARGMVGWPLCHLVFDRFDNRERLDEIAEMNPRPDVTIIHGAGDSIVPVRNGRALAAMHPDWIRYIEIPGGDHNWILDTAEAEIHAAMLADRQSQGESP